MLFRSSYDTFIRSFKIERQMQYKDVNVRFEPRAAAQLSQRSTRSGITILDGYSRFPLVPELL
jgi:hypothetical protein